MKAIALALALTLGAGAFGATVQPVAAEAHQMMMKGPPMMRPHPQFRFFFGPPFFFGPRFYEREQFVGPCHWLKVRAEVTGKRYWWNRWRECLADHGIY